MITQKKGQSRAGLRLEETPGLYAAAVKNLAEGIYLIRLSDGVIVLANPRFETMFGYEPGELTGKNVAILNAPTDKSPEAVRDAIIRTLEDVGEWHGDIENIKKDGTRFWCRAHVSVLDVSSQGRILVSVHTDITARRQMEVYKDLAKNILKILNEPGELAPAIQRIIATMKTQTGLDAVGIRLQAGEDFPYFAQEGFPQNFLLTENTLIARARGGGICRNTDGSACLECTCGLVLSGKTDPANPIFTPGGSCVLNDSFPLLNLPLAEDPRLHPRNLCIHHGYASVALIPIRTGEKIVGLIQLNDRRKDRFALGLVELVEGIAAHIGIAMMRKQAEQESRDSERRWKFAVEGAGDGLWDWNVRASTVFFTKRWKEMLGFTEDEIGTGLEEWSTRVHPDDLARVMAAVQAHFAGTTPSYSCEHRVRCKDGRWKWMLDRGLVVERDAAGQPQRMIGTHKDITERKLREEDEHRSLVAADRARLALLSVLEDQQRAQTALTWSLRDKDSLLKELHHRVKNDLQIVASLLRLESARHRTSEATSVLGNIAQRVHTMALLHEHLHRSASFSMVDLGAYLAQLSRQALDTMAPPGGAIGLQLQLAPVAVSMDQAVGCGLLVNELISNATKHGFPAGRAGEIRIELLQVDGGPEARLRLSDTGVGLPADFATRRGRSLGLQLANDLALQLGGTLDVGPGPEASFSVTFMAAPVPHKAA